MPPRRNRASTSGASTSRRRRREPTPPPPPSPPPSPLPWELPTPTQHERYRVLHKRAVIPSKFFDPYSINALRINEDVNLFTDNIGWDQFVNMRLPTYKSITFEILSTLQSTYHPHVSGDPICIFFRCMGEDRQLRMSEFNGIFGFPNEGLNWHASEFRPELAWRQLTTQSEYKPSSSKSIHIRNPALRYIHRVMSHSLFGRGESTGVVSKVELLFLWGMANEVAINTGAWLLKHLLHVAGSTTGKICVGGILSLVANHFGFVAEEGVHHAVQGSILIDIDTLLNMRLCRHIGGGQFQLLDDEGQPIEMPEQNVAEDEENEEEEPQQEEQPHVQQEEDMGGVHEHNPEPHPDWQMMQMMERFDRLETRMTRSEDFQLQMMQLMQQNLEATARIEDKLSHLK